MKQVTLKAFVLFFAASMWQSMFGQVSNDGVLQYETFLEIYESMANSRGDKHLPSNEIINKYGLTKKEFNNPIGKTIVVGQNFDIINNTPQQKGKNAWWIVFGDEDDSSSIFMYFDKVQYVRFRVAAREYGLVKALMWPINDGDMSHDLYFAAKKTEKGKIIQVHSKKECNDRQVIGKFDYSDKYKSVELGFNEIDGIPDKYYDDLISFDDIIKLNGDFQSLTKSHGFKQTDIEVEGARFPTGYIYKNCIVNDSGVKPSGSGTPICIIANGSMTYTSYTIKLFDSVAMNQMAVQFLKYAVMNNSSSDLTYKFKWSNGETCDFSKCNYNDDGNGGEIIIDVPF